LQKSPICSTVLAIGCDVIMIFDAPWERPCFFRSSRFVITLCCYWATQDLRCWVVCHSQFAWVSVFEWLFCTV